MGIFNFLFGWMKGKNKARENDEIVSTATSEPIGATPQPTANADSERTPRPNVKAESESTAQPATKAESEPTAEPKKKTRTKAPKKEEPTVIAEEQAVEDYPISEQVVEVSSAEDQTSTQDMVTEDQASVESETVFASKPERTGRFEIKKARDGRYVFNLFASNHVIIATSQVYSSAQSALNGVKSVMANAENAPIEDQTIKGYTTLLYPKWELYMDNGGQYRFRLCASNGSCICHSQGYTSKANAKNGIESIQRFAKNAEIDKAYLEK